MTSVNTSMPGLTKKITSRVDKRRSNIPLDEIASITGTSVSELQDDNEETTMTNFAAQLTEMR